MKKLFICIAGLLINYFVAAQTAVNVIPQPNEITINKGSFIFSSCTRLQADASLKNSVEPLITKLSNAAGIDILSKNICAKKSLINIKIDNEIMNDEGYEIKILPEEISLKAKTPAGIFYGVQTILQLLPEAIEKDSLQKNIRWTVPCIAIKDAPRFTYRGIMLDVARHYMPMDFIKKTG